MFLVFFLAVAVTAGSPTEIFVATNGNDKSGTGSITAPYATISRAQVDARRIAAGAMTADVTVSIRAGAYAVTQAIAFNETDSGNNGHYVRYGGYGAEMVTIHGGVPVVGWASVAGAAWLWSAPMPDGVPDTRQVYINGRRMTATTTPAFPKAGSTLTATGYITPGPLPDGIFLPMQDQTTIEFLYTGVGSSWTECRLRVQSIGRTATGTYNITMQQPGFAYAVQRSYGQGVSFPVTMTNVFSLLGPSTPGQYYLNTAKRTMYYVPQAGEDMRTAVVVVPNVHQLVLGDGVRFVTLERLTFSYAGWLAPNHGLGYVDQQSGFLINTVPSPDDASWPAVPGNLHFQRAWNVSVVNCTFTHLGATAIRFDEGSQSILIHNNTFRDVSCGATYLGQVNDVNQTDPLKQNSYMVVDNNYMENIPVEYRDCAPILGGYLLHTIISRNTILNPPNTGISLGWGWSRDKATNAGYNTITKNYVFGSNWLLEDGGSFYVLGPQPASVMSENFSNGQKKLFGAFYTDEGSAYWHITRCVAKDCPEWLHIWTSSIHDEVVDFCWSNQRYQQNAGTRITENNITFIDGNNFPPEG